MMKTKENEEAKNEMGMLTRNCIKQAMKTNTMSQEDLILLVWFRKEFFTPEETALDNQKEMVIVESINDNNDKDTIYEVIYNDNIIPCINAIKKGDYCFAYDRYKNTLLFLEHKYMQYVPKDILVKSLKK